MFNKKKTRHIYRCSFCSKSKDQVERLIAGPGGVYICDECVALCNQIIQEERTRHQRASSVPIEGGQATWEQTRTPPAEE